MLVRILLPPFFVLIRPFIFLSHSHSHSLLLLVQQSVNQSIKREMVVVVIKEGTDGAINCCRHNNTDASNVT